MDISQLIAERRQALGLSRGDVGRACGYHGDAARSVPRRWEQGDALPPLDRVRRLAAALSLPLDLLIP